MTLPKYTQGEKDFNSFFVECLKFKKVNFNLNGIFWNCCVLSGCILFTFCSSWCRRFWFVLIGVLIFRFLQIFFRAGALERLESQRDEKLTGHIILLQARCRGYLARRKLNTLKVNIILIFRRFQYKIFYFCFIGHKKFNLHSISFQWKIHYRSKV